MAVWPINTLHPVHREEEAWLNTRWVCKLIVSKSVRCFIELLILRSQAEKHPIYVQRCCWSSSGASSSLALRWPGTSGTSSWACASSSCPTSGLPALWPNDRSNRKCVSPSSKHFLFQRCLQPSTHTHTHTGVSLAFLTGRSFHLTPPCALL